MFVEARGIQYFSDEESMHDKVGWDWAVSVPRLLLLLLGSLIAVSHLCSNAF